MSQTQTLRTTVAECAKIDAQLILNNIRTNQQTYYCQICNCDINKSSAIDSDALNGIDAIYILCYKCTKTCDYMQKYESTIHPVLQLSGANNDAVFYETHDAEGAMFTRVMPDSS